MTADGAVAPAGNPQGRAKVFVSYARKDIVFVDRLDAALKARGIEPLIDRSDIYAFEDWWKRIESLISHADTVVFVLSPDALSSDVAQKEIQFAASLNKRLAPVVCRPVDQNQVPETIRRLNFIFFDGEPHFDARADQLVEALQTDIDWIRKHTEFSEAAHRWTAAGRPGPRGLLLRSPVLDEAERWLSSRPEGAPAPTEGTHAFIVESRKAATRRRNLLTGTLAVGLAVALGLAGLAYWMLRISEIQRNDALIAQSRFLTRDSRAATDSGNAVLGALLALRALPKNLANPDRPFLADSAFALEQALANRRERFAVRSKGLPDRLTFSSDGSRLFAFSHRTFEAWDAQSGKEIVRVEDERGFQSARLLAGDSRLVTRTYGGSGPNYTTAVWDLNSGTRLWSGSASASDEEPLVSPDGNRAMARSQSGKAIQLWDVGANRLIATLPEELERMRGAVAFSPDGTRAATVSNANGLQIWNTDTGAVMATLRREYMSSPTFSTDGRRLLVQWSRRVLILDSASASELAALPGGLLSKTEFSHDGSKILTATIGMGQPVRIQLWNAETGEQVSAFQGHSDDVFRMELSPDGSRLATFSSDGTIRLWNAATGAQLGVWRWSGNWPSILFSPDSTRLYVVLYDNNGEGNTTRVIDAAKGTELATLQGRLSAGLNSVATVLVIEPNVFSSDGTRVITASQDGTARIWDIRTASQFAVLKGDDMAVRAAAFSPDGANIATGSGDGQVRLWSTEPAAVVRVFRGHTDAVNSVSTATDGTRLVTGSADKTARVWNVATGATERVLSGHGGAVRSAAFSPDGTRILTASADGTARVWNAETGAEILALKGHQGEVNAAAYSPRGTHILTTSADKTGRIWDAQTGATIMVLEHDGPVYSGAFSPDGTQILTAGIEKAVARLWNATDGRLLREMHPNTNNPRLSENRNIILRNADRLALSRSARGGTLATAAAFSPDGTRVATATYHWLVQLWESDTALKTMSLFGTDDGVWSLSYSPDSVRLVAGINDKSAAIWQADEDLMNSIRPIVALRAHLGPIKSAVFLPDGAHVVTASADHTLRLWRLPRCQSLIDVANAGSPRPLNNNERGRYFLWDNAEDREARIFSTVRNLLAFALPRAGDACR